MRDRHTYMKRRREKMDKNNYSERILGVYGRLGEKAREG